MNRRLFLYTGAAVAAIAAGTYAYRSRSPSDASVSSGEPAVGTPGQPEADPVARLQSLALPNLDGKLHRIDQWRGRPMVVNFWATWCAPCVKEMPELQTLHKKYPAIQFVGIGIDKVENMRQFLQKVPVSYPLLVMQDGATDLLRQLGNPAGGLPFTLILQGDGVVNRKILGQIQFNDLDRSLSSLPA